jgi:hypothetical protein
VVYCYIVLSTTCFISSYEPSSCWLLFLSKVKYTISNAVVIVTYETLYNMYKTFELKLIPLYNSITNFKLVEVKYYYIYNIRLQDDIYSWNVVWVPKIRELFLFNCICGFLIDTVIVRNTTHTNQYPTRNRHIYIQRYPLT